MIKPVNGMNERCVLSYNSFISHLTRHQPLWVQRESACRGETMPPDVKSDILNG